ncbi:hypothetical protein [Tahibacter aquaticus]|uniref:hypothetical protein n=1 Tax=Tahibacter aquaticus TaxID=520092 RepID=UPI0010623980|nr:hypothetical protein [Tahibacter aquaticus]
MPSADMHDWTLVSTSVDWALGVGRLDVRWDGFDYELRFSGLQRFTMPREFGWGPSVSINVVRGPEDSLGKQRLQIEMQSGDVIEIIAESFELPAVLCVLRSVRSPGSQDQRKMNVPRCNSLRQSHPK